MASRLLSDGNAPAYNDAEKGLIDVHSPRPATALPAFNTVSQVPSYPLDEKKADLTSPTLFSPPEKKREPPAAVAPKPAGKKKQKASKWTLWRLWFNTYR